MKLKTPNFPNFLRFEGEADTTISIGALSDDELEEYAEFWKKELIKHAKVRRELFKLKGTE
jgi:hypothetical protein